MDWISKAAERIHREYPKILRECNDQTPLPWLHAVIREAAPFQPDVAYMPVPRCDQCKHWGMPLKNVGVCVKQELKVPTIGKMLLSTSANFGCVMWEAK